MRVCSEDHQGSVLDPLLFLTYIKVLAVPSRRVLFVLERCWIDLSFLEYRYAIGGSPAIGGMQLNASIFTSGVAPFSGIPNNPDELFILHRVEQVSYRW